MDEIAIVIDQNDNIIFSNKAFEKILVNKKKLFELEMIEPNKKLDDISERFYHKRKKRPDSMIIQKEV